MSDVVIMQELAVSDLEIKLGQSNCHILTL